MISQLSKFHFWWISSPLLIFFILASLGALAHPLWGDEAETALFARNVLKKGVPYAFDGVNITSLNDAILLNQDLVNNTDPWPAFYLTALSFKVFGESSFNARLPFLLMAMLCIPLIYLTTLKITGGDKMAAFISSLLLATSVPFLLYSYQARYYVLTAFAGLLVIYSALSLENRKLWPNLVFVFSGILYVYSNYIIFAVFYFVLFMTLIFHKIQTFQGGNQIRKFIYRYILLGLFIGLSFIPWYAYFQPFSGRHITWYLDPGTLIYHFSYIPGMLYGLLSDVLFPIILLPFMLAAIFRKSNLGIKDQFKEFPVIFLISIYLITVVILATIAEPSDTSIIYIRYHTILFPLVSIATAIFLSGLIKNHKALFGFLLSLIIFTNLLALSMPRFYLFEYIKEVTNPYPVADQMVADYLKKHSKEGDLAFVSLDRAHDPLIFLLGDRLRFVNRVTGNNPRIFPKSYKVLPKYIYSYLDKPDWIILYGKNPDKTSFWAFDTRDSYPLGLLPNFDLEKEYEETILPVFFGSDVSRPELAVHQFEKKTPAFDEQVFIYQKKPH